MSNTHKYKGKIDNIILRDQSFSMIVNGAFLGVYGNPDEKGVKQGMLVWGEYVDKKVGTKMYKNVVTINTEEDEQVKQEAKEKYHIKDMGVFETEKAKMLDRLGDQQVFGRCFYGIFLESIRCAQLLPSSDKSYEEIVKDYVTINIKLFNELY